MNLKTTLSKLVFVLLGTIYRTKASGATSSLAIRLDFFSTLGYYLSIDQSIFSPNANQDPKPISDSLVDFEVVFHKNNKVRMGAKYI